MRSLEFATAQAKSNIPTNVAAPPSPSLDPGPETALTPPVAADEWTTPKQDRVRSWRIAFIVVAAAGATVAMVLLIFFRSRSIVEPTAAIVVAGDPQWDSSVVRVSAEGEQVASVVLNHENGWRTPILLQPGDYLLHVDVGGKPLITQQFVVGYMRARTFDLPTAITVVGNAAFDGAAVQLNGSPEPADAPVLTAENQFTTLMYRRGGTYRLRVVRESKTVYEARFELIDHHPAVIHLDSLPSNPMR